MRVISKQALLVVGLLTALSIPSISRGAEVDGLKATIEQRIGGKWQMVTVHASPIPADGL